MYRNMEDWSEIRRRVLVEGVSKRQILRETKLHWLTLKKILAHSEPPGYRQQQPRPQKKLGAFLERIKQILKEDQAMPRKQRHTAKRIWERLQEDGFTGGYTVVKDAVRELVKFTRSNFFVPVPQVRELAELNDYLLQRCQEDQGRRLRGQPHLRHVRVAAPNLASYTELVGGVA